MNYSTNKIDGRRPYVHNLLAYV